MVMCMIFSFCKNNALITEAVKAMQHFSFYKKD